jgi:hypothetical protein
MADKGIKTYDATQYHIWTWVYKKDNTYAMYVDGIRVQGGSNYFWTYGNTEKDEPIDMDFLFDGSWGHNQIGSVNKEMDATELDGKFYEWNYSRVYLSGDGEPAKKGPHALPGTIKATDSNSGEQGIAFDKTANGGQWRKYAVQVPTSGRYKFNFQVASLKGGGTLSVEDENNTKLIKPVVVPSSGSDTKSATMTVPTPVTLSAGAHTLKWIQDSNSFKISSLTVTKVPGPTAVFIKTDLTTQGTWKGVYGADGYMIAADATKQPAYGTTSRTAWEVKWNGNGQTSDVRAPQRVDGGPNDRIAGQWGSNDKTYDIDCNLTDNAIHQVSLYGLDWDLNGRTQDIQVLDAETGGVLDTQDMNTYVSGKYFVWNIQGHVIFRIRNNSVWTNPALSGIFFDPVAPTTTKPKPVATIPPGAPAQTPNGGAAQTPNGGAAPGSRL